MPWWFCLVALLLGAGSVQAAGPAPGATGPIPVASFFTGAGYRAAALSPNGKFLAYLVVPADEPDYLVVLDLATKVPTAVAQYNVSVLHFAWVGDNRLVYEIATRGWGTALRAVDRDGKQRTFLASSTQGGINGGPTGRLLLPWGYFNIDPCNRQNRSTIYVAHAEPDPSYEVRSINLMRMDSASGRAATLPRPRNAKMWMLDQDGEPRVGMVSDGKQETLITRDPHSEQWRTAKTFSTLTGFKGGSDDVMPLAFGPDGTLYVVAHAGRDTSAVHRFDLHSGQLDPTPVFSAAGYDFDGELVTTCDKVLGVHFRTDAESIEWFDPAMKTVQQTVDKLLPATINIISVPSRAETPWMLVRSYSDVVAPLHYLFNNSTGKAELIGPPVPELDPKRMGRQTWLRYPARDGLQIPALLTLPPGKPAQNLPLVVLVHGGPNVRGNSWGWDAESQFLASRGYAVLEPEFRGSTGFGTAHMVAGWRQWGLAMQNDLADGARWAVKQGYADARKICIAGASYGGYAALMGLVNDGDLYQCGIDRSGVSDLQLYYSGGWNYPSDMTSIQRQFGYKTTIGDPEHDAAQLAATSPFYQAGRIQRPLLLAHGGRDWRVPVDHGTRIRDAVRRTNNQVEWVEYPDEGHGGWTLDDTVDFWTRAEKFLQKNIGPE